MFLDVKQNRRLRLNIEEHEAPPTDHITLLGVEIENQSTSSKHIETSCSIVKKKISAFFRLNNCISRNQA